MSKPIELFQWEAFLESLSEGATITEASKAAGFSRASYWNYVNGQEPINKDFARAVEEIMRVRVSVVEGALYKNARDGNLGAQIFFLCNQASQKWSNKHLQKTIHEGKIDINITDKQKESELTARVKRLRGILDLTESEN